MSTKFCFIASRRPSYRRGTCSSMHPTAFGFSRPDLDGKKLSKGMRRVYLIVPRVVNYSFFF